MSMMLRVAEMPPATVVLIEKLTVVNPEAGHLGYFICNRAYRPLVCKTHLVTEALCVRTVAAAGRNLTFWPSNHVAT